MNKVVTLLLVLALCALAIVLALSGGPLAPWLCLGIFLVPCFILANMPEVNPWMPRRQDALQAMNLLLGNLNELDKAFPNPYDFLLQESNNPRADRTRTAKRQRVDYIELADEAYYSLFSDFRSLKIWVLVNGRWIPLYFHHRFPTRSDELLGIGLGPYSWSERLPLPRAQLDVLGPIAERMVFWGLRRKYDPIEV